MEQQRVDFATELACALYLSARLAVAEERAIPGDIEREEIIEILTPFERNDLLPDRGRSFLGWARQLGIGQK